MKRELEFLKRLRSWPQPEIPWVSIGIGDDCAEVKNLLISKDLFVEGVHFDTKFLSFYEAGRKSLLVNLSDIASMGAVPLGYLAAISFRGDERVFFETMDGMRRVSEEFGVPLIGGDLSGGDRLVISITVLGFSDNPVRRRGASEGDLVFVTGTLGDSSLGLELMRRDLYFPFLWWRHKNPVPRLREGAVLASLGVPSSMIDLSDGLVPDLFRLATENGLGFVIYAEKLPRSYHFDRAISELGLDPLNFILYGGEDYELLFTASREKLPAVERLPFRVTLVGEMVDSGFYIKKDGGIEPLDIKGYEHFEK